MNFLNLPVFQYAFVVADVEAAMARWTRLFGAGPWYMNPHFKPAALGLNYRYRGSSEHPDLTYAFGYCGEAHIQLIQQFDEVPSIYREMYPRGQEGLHHVAYLAADVTAEKARLKAMGLTLATELWGANNVDVAYFDARAFIGCFIEVYKDDARARGSFLIQKRAHDKWDGKTEPQRPYPGPAESIEAVKA